MREKKASSPKNSEWESAGYDKGRKTRRRIVDAASRLFASHGYDATSIDQISAASGLTKGAVYGHFNRKRELYIACLEDCLKFFRENIAIDASLPPDEALTVYLSWLGSKFAKKGVARSLFIQMIREDDDNLKTKWILDLMTPPFQQFRTLIQNLNGKIEASAYTFIVFSTLLLDPDLHRYYVLMARESAASHNIDATVRRLVSMVKHAR